MILLSPNQYDDLIPILSNYGPNQPMIDAVLSGFNPGQVWINAMDPKQGVALITGLGFAFGWGDQVNDLLVMKSNERKKKITFVPKPNGVETKIHSGIKGERFEFVNHQLVEVEMTVPAGFKIADVDQYTAKNLNWAAPCLDIFGSYQQFEKMGGGVGLFNGQQIISEAIVGYVGRSRVEIGTATHADYQAKGFSKIVSAVLIHKLYKRGQIPYWSCASDNVASQKVAKIIGFSDEVKYSVYYFT